MSEPIENHAFVWDGEIYRCECGATVKHNPMRYDITHTAFPGQSYTVGPDAETFTGERVCPPSASIARIQK